MKHLLLGTILWITAGIPLPAAAVDTMTDIGTLETRLDRALEQRDRAALEPLITPGCT